MKKIYGLRFDPTHGDAPERVADAKGLCYRQQTAALCQKSDFDNCFPWSEMQECNLMPDGRVIFAGEAGFSRTQNTFIRVPVFYFKRTLQGDTEEWLISGHPHEGFAPEPWFLNADGTLSPYRYIAKYEGCAFENGEVSVTGRTPQRYFSTEKFKQGCADAGFSLCSIYAYLAMQHLFVIECGTLDAQAVNSGVSFVPYSSLPLCLVENGGRSNTAILPYHWRWETVEPGTPLYVSTEVAGDLSNRHELLSMRREGELLYLELDGEPIDFEKGVTRVFASAYPTGGCDGMQYVNGRPSNNRHTSPFLYRGIENLYGNTWEMMDGIGYAAEEQRVLLDDRMLSFVSPFNQALGEEGTGFIARLGFDPERPFATFPCELGATECSHYHAEWSTFGKDRRAVAFGGGWDHFFCNSIFCMRTVSHHAGNWLYGYRAMK